jgi:predicted nucleic acid-binding protein
VTIVVDASFVVAAVLNKGPEGTWARQILLSDALAAPHLMPAEAASVLRAAVFAGLATERDASVAYLDMQAISVGLSPFEAFATRVWELRGNVSAYDAWYVALAESLNAPLATLDGRLARAPGPRCEFLTFPR